MKKLTLSTTTLILSIFLNAQDFTTIPISDWNKLKNSSFVESINNENTSSPGDAPWLWGINIGHSSNNSTSLPANYNGQIAFSVNYGMDAPQMYIRSTNQKGEGLWAKVIHNLGNQEINGNLDVAGSLTVKNNINIESDYMVGRWLHNTFTYDNQQMGHYAIKWGTDSWNYGGPTLWQSAYAGMKFFTGGKPSMAINQQGNIGIGTENPQHKLEVNGTIRAKEIKVESGWADFVFSPDYNLKSLSEVKEFIQENSHLPGIPTESEVKENGVGLGDMTTKLLQKIEELTLYMIQQDEKIDVLSAKLLELENPKK